MSINFRTMSLIDIFDDVVDGVFTTEQLTELAQEIYADKRGGYLAPLINSTELMNVLNERMSHA